MTVQGPVKKQQPDGMSHRGGRGGEVWEGALVTGQCQEASLKPRMMKHQLRRERARTTPRPPAQATLPPALCMRPC